MSVSTSAPEAVETIYDILTEYSNSTGTSTVSSGETVTVQSGETFITESIANAGTFQTAGTTQVQDIWQLEPPEIEYHWNVPQAQKGPGADQPPEFYIFSPTDDSMNKFSADGKHTDETQTVLVEIYLLKDDSNPTEIKQYARDTIDILTEYYADNRVQTNFHEIEPTTQGDFRAQSSARQSDYFIHTVEVDARKLQST